MAAFEMLSYILFVTLADCYSCLFLFVAMATNYVAGKKYSSITTAQEVDQEQYRQRNAQQPQQSITGFASSPFLIPMMPLFDACHGRVSQKIQAVTRNSQLMSFV
jgi:hypothetical protein